MVELTPVGKIAIAAVAGLAFYFLVLPFLASILFPQENVERSSEIRVVAFLKTFDLDSARLQETLRELEADKNMQRAIKLDVINVDAEPGKMKQNNISREEVPCFILGTKKYGGWHSLDWFKERITSLKGQDKEKKA